jgi:hypothetical protein
VPKQRNTHPTIDRTVDRCWACADEAFCRLMQPLTGTLPHEEAQWQPEFETYQAIPQYRKLYI